MKAMIRFNTRSRKAGLSMVNETSVAKKQENALSETEDETLSSSLSSSFSSSSSRDGRNIFQYHDDEVVQSLNGETEKDYEAASTELLRTSNNNDDDIQPSHQAIEDRLRHRIKDLQDELTRRIERTNKLRTFISSIDSDDDDDDDGHVSKSMKELEANEDELRECIVELEKELAQRSLRTVSTDVSELRSDDSVVVLKESIDNSNWQEVNLWDEDDDDDQSSDSSSVQYGNNKTGTCAQCEYVGVWTAFDMSADDNISEEEEDTTLGMWKEVDIVTSTTPTTCESFSTEDDNKLSSTKNKELANNSSSSVKLAWVSEKTHVVCAEALAA